MVSMSIANIRTDICGNLGLSLGKKVRQRNQREIEFLLLVASLTFAIQQDVSLHNNGTYNIMESLSAIVCYTRFRYSFKRSLVNASCKVHAKACNIIMLCDARNSIGPPALTLHPKVCGARVLTFERSVE